MEIQRTIECQEGILRGIVHHPITSNILGTIIILHGYFSSQKCGPARFYIQLARYFSNLGYQVWRFDCYGVGDSDGDFRDIIFDLHLKNYKKIIAVAQNENKSNNLILCGHSVGSNMAVYLSLEKVFNIHKTVLISPSFGEFNGKEPLLNTRHFHELQTKGFTTRKGFFVHKAYIEIMQDKSIYSKLLLISNPIFIAIGAKDQFFSNTILKNMSFKDKDTMIIFKEADHNFLNQDMRKELLENLKKFL